MYNICHAERQIVRKCLPIVPSSQELAMERQITFYPRRPLGRRSTCGSFAYWAVYPARDAPIIKLQRTLFKDQYVVPQRPPFGFTTEDFF